MSVASEITRLQNAKASLKSSINAKTDQQHQITNETIDHYSDFVDSIQTGGGTSYPPDWSQIGYNNTPQSVIDDFNYAKEIYDNWNINVSDLSNKFNSDDKLVYMPLVDTSNVTNIDGCFGYCTNLYYVPLLNTSNITSMQSSFSSCKSLKSIPLLDTKNVTTMRFAFQECSFLEDIPQFDTSSIVRLSNMFTNCPKLTDTSLNNILKMCININPNYSRSKTLYELGLSSSNYPSSKIKTLPSYQDFINAGWTIGY